MTTSPTTTAPVTPDEAEAALLAMGPVLEWKEHAHRAAWYSFPLADTWYEITDTRQWHDSDAAPICALYSAPGVVDIDKKAYWSYDNAKAACERHHATGKWD